MANNRFKDAALRTLEERKLQQLMAARADKVQERNRLAEVARLAFEQKKKEDEKKREVERVEQERKQEELRRETIRLEEQIREEERRQEEERREEQRQEEAQAAEKERLRLEALKLPPPECSRCKHLIYKGGINAAGKHWHKEHFVCYQCDRPLEGGKFYDKEGQLYCDADYLRLFAKKCARCRQPILSKVYEANGMFFHQDHLACLECDAPLLSGYREALGLLYCVKHADGPKTCFGCNGKIENEEVITAMGRTWHTPHFVCCECRQPPPNGAFCERDGKAYCEADFDRLFSPKCHACSQPITGRVVTAMGVNWHAEHFVCTKCKTSLTGGIAHIVRDGKPFCEAC